MGCCMPFLRLQPTDVDDLVHPSDTGSEESRAPQPFIPGVVKNLSVAVNPKKPSVTLTWSCPDNCVNAGDIKRYHIHFCAMICNDLEDSQNDVEDFMDLTTMICDFLETQMTSGSVEVLGSLTEVTLDRSDDLIPMLKYAFEVQAESQQGSLGEAQLATIYLDWHCRFPTCTETRISMNPPYLRTDLYDFCGNKHKIQFDEKYCLFSECVQLKSASGASVAKSKLPVHQKNHFCSDDHRVLAKCSKAAYLIWLDPSSSEFKKVNGQFTKSWCKKKGICPTVFSILGIINPAVEDTLSGYRQTLPRGHSSTEMYFHGTHLDCKLFLDEFHTLCTGHGCGICSISRSGFLPEEIRRDRFQRFGHAFYLAPNSSKSNDYCTKQCNVRYTAMLLCEVAPGKKHILRTNMTSLQEPPNGYNSVYGKSKFLFFAGDLNYDEIVIFKPEAICPRYVLLYR